jgi:hypothetical protein
MGLRASLIAVCLFSAASTHAKGTPGEARFPASVSDKLLQDFVSIGHVDAMTPRAPEEWLRWGGAPVEHQTSAIRAVVEALSATRPPIGVAAAILAIARVESGWNPYSRNPTSSACGLFQFISATWASYEPSQERCFDPKANASAGVKHLVGLYQTHVAPRLTLLVPITTEAERVAWTYRMLYAFHYHGEGAPVAEGGGSPAVQTVADAGLPTLQEYFTVLKRVTTVVPSRGRRGRGRGTPAHRPAARTRVASR